MLGDDFFGMFGIFSWWGDGIVEVICCMLRRMDVKMQEQYHRFYGRKYGKMVMFRRIGHPTPALTDTAAFWTSSLSSPISLREKLTPLYSVHKPLFFFNSVHRSILYSVTNM